MSMYSPLGMLESSQVGEVVMLTSPTVHVLALGFWAECGLQLGAEGSWFGCHSGGLCRVGVASGGFGAFYLLQTPSVSQSAAAALQGQSCM